MVKKVVEVKRQDEHYIRAEELDKIFKNQESEGQDTLEAEENIDYIGFLRTFVNKLKQADKKINDSFNKDDERIKKDFYDLIKHFKKNKR